MTNYQDYLIILSPPENVANYIRKQKNFSAEIIGEYKSQNSKAHLSIQYLPRKKPVWFEPLMSKLERELQTMPPVELEINGFAFFDQQEFQTIYARLNSTPATKLWFKLLRNFFCTPPFEPHITIVRNIPKEDFKTLWPLFSCRSLNARFKVDKLTILRRETIGYDKSYKVFKEIPFNARLSFDDFTKARLKAPVLSKSKVDSQQINLF